MKNGLAYRHKFINIEGATVQTLIYDTLYQIADDADVEYRDLTEAGDPAHLSTIDSDEDKLTVVKAKQYIIKFLSSTEYNLNTFSDGPDDRYYVESDINGIIIFKGFLTLDDNREAFLPHTNIVTLTATDKLGALKDSPLTLDDGTNPKGKYKLGTLIALCLKKTGLNLPINVVNNLRHGSGEFTYNTEFFGLLDTIRVATTTLTGQFYPGQEIVISGTASNNGTKHVRTVSFVAGETVLTIVENVVSESSVSTTFTDTSSSTHIYDTIYLDAKTFESQIGECENCYTVLEKILGENCFITQYKGEWRIFRVDEWDENQIYVAEFDSDGEFQSLNAPTDFNRTIEPGGSLFFSEERTEGNPQRPLGYGKETYNYETAREIIANIDFSRGDELPGGTEALKTFEVEDWDFQRFTPMGASPTSPVGAAYIVRRYELPGYESERYVKIEEGPGVHGIESLKSEGIPWGAKDKAVISIDFRLNEDIGDTFNLISALSIELVGDDGNYYYGQEDGYGTYNIGIPDLIFNTYDPTGQDTTQWMTLVINLGPAPVSGTLYLYLGQSAPGAATEIDFQNLQFDYIPYINGSYRKYTGQYNRIDRATAQNSGVKATGYLAKRDEDVFMSDSPRQIFKGAMLIFSNDIYVLANRFYPHNVFPGDNPDGDSVKAYGTVQAFDVWNQFLYNNSVFQFSIQGNKDNPGFVPPFDLIEKYTINETDELSRDRYFMLLTFDHDLFLCSSVGTMIESYRRNLLKQYGDVWERKFIS